MEVNTDELLEELQELINHYCKIVFNEDEMDDDTFESGRNEGVWVGLLKAKRLIEKHKQS
jgi:hypothetical protein